MDARAKGATELFVSNDRYFVPPYQRPYVWTEERQWLPLWEDITRLADGRLEGEANIHFLGAIVIRRESSEPGGLTEWSVIDGQQRLTTLQIMIAAVAHVAAEDQAIGTASQLRKLTVHDEYQRGAEGDRRYRFWPTTVNAAAFRSVMHEDGRDPALEDDPENTIEEAWAFFRERARDYAGNVDGDESEFGTDPVVALERRYGALHDAITGLLQLVAITLEPGDPAQVIFETLNARGTPLLATDLVKNALFDKAERSGLDLESIHADHWANQLGDIDYWSEDERLGRLTIPRSEGFLMHWMAMKLGEVVGSDSLFDRFRREFIDSPSSPPAIEVLDELNADAAILRSFQAQAPGTPAGDFLATARVLDTTTFHPVALALLRAGLADADLRKAFGALESFLIRRMIFGLTAKSYNLIAADLSKNLLARPEDPAQVIVERLLTSQSATFRWPTDDEVVEHLATHPLYGWMGRGRLVYLLSAVELSRRAGKTEGITQLPNKLEVEHLLPQAWQTNWSLGAVATEDEVAFRETHINRLGNLTLVAGGLNASMSNSEWSTKRDALQEHSILMLNKELTALEAWDEQAIDARCRTLAVEIAKIWPGPEHFMPEEWNAPDAEMSPENAQLDAADLVRVCRSASPYLWALLQDLAEHQGERRTYKDIESSLGWPRGRIAPVLSGYYRGNTDFGSLRPWHLNLDGKGNWWMWIDPEAAETVGAEVERRQAKVGTIDELRESIIDPEARELVDLIPRRFGEIAGITQDLRASNSSQAVRLKGREGRAAAGYFAKNWLLLWLRGRFDGDEAWFKANLSKPDEVRIDANGTLRFHVVNAADLEALISALVGEPGP